MLPFEFPVAESPTGHRRVVSTCVSCNGDEENDVRYSRFLDLVHTVMICLANWMYLIAHFGNGVAAQEILWYVLYPLVPR